MNRIHALEFLFFLLKNSIKDIFSLHQKCIVKFILKNECRLHYFTENVTSLFKKNYSNRSISFQFSPNIIIVLLV